MFLHVLLAALAAGAAAPAPEGPLTVSAAISLTEALEAVADAWRRSGGADVRFNFGASNSLARQILLGAPVDAFVSADAAQMDLVERAGRLVPGSRVEVVRNRLAVVARPASAAFVREQFDRAPPEIRRLAIGDPQAVPAGVYARQYLESRGLWTAYRSRVVPAASVRAALAAVENGAADAAIVYASDVRVARRAVLSFVVDPREGPPIVYPGAAIAASTRQSDVAAFLAFLRSPEAQAVFERHGFLPLAR